MQLTRRNFFRIGAATLVLPSLPLSLAAPSDSSWSFGVMADTHASTREPFYGSAIHNIAAINAEFIRHQVDFVIQVGDLVGGGAIAEHFQARAARNKVLEEAGIRYYPVRGNHDSENRTRAVAPYKAAFPNLPGTPGNGGSSPDLPAAAGLTYSFTHRGGKFILLDTFPMLGWEDGIGNENHQWYDGSVLRKAYTVGDYLPWIESELKKDDHQFAMVFGHKNLVGQNHKDHLFNLVYPDQTDQDALPEMQNAFFACLQRYGVRYYFSGHDHMYHRSLVKSPDGKSQIEQLICGSAFQGFYLPKPPYSERAVPLVQETRRNGFMIVRVDDKRVRFEYYSTELFGSEPKMPTWERRDSFDYAIPPKSQPVS